MCTCFLKDVDDGVGAFLGESLLLLLREVAQPVHEHNMTSIHGCVNILQECGAFSYAGLYVYHYDIVHSYTCSNYRSTIHVRVWAGAVEWMIPGTMPAQIQPHMTAYEFYKREIIVSDCA